MPGTATIETAGPARRFLFALLGTALPAAFLPGAATAQERLPPGTVRLIERLAPPVEDSRTVQLRKGIVRIAGPVARATAVLVAPGKLLTNCHALVPNANAGLVTAIDPASGRTYPITEVGWIKHKDACVAVVPGMPGDAVEIGDSRRLPVGARLTNVGYFGSDGLNSSDGALIQVEVKNGQTFIASSNRCPPGTSGGPLLDDTGRLVGLVTGGRRGGDNACLSLTVETALTALDETPVPLGMLPKYYESNVLAPIERR